MIEGPGAARRRARLALTVLLGLAGAVACAKVAPPPGGPEDRDAPTVVTDSVFPAPGSGGVGPEDTVRIVFSERPDRRSVMRALRTWPDVDFRDVSWEADTLLLVPEPAWAADRNTLLRIGTGAKDRRGNPMGSAFLLSFSTKDVADSGEIAGRVWVGRERDDTRPVVLLALDASDSLDAEEPPLPHALAEADRQGGYRLVGLDTGRAWRVVGMIDLDDDLVADRRGEVSATAPEIVRFEPPAKEGTVADFLVGTLDSLGKITGEVVADSGAVVFVRATPEEATGDMPQRTAAPVGGGPFTLDAPTGRIYDVSAFVDADGDSIAGPEETVLDWKEPVSLRFTTNATGLRFDLATPPPEENLELEPAEEAEGVDGPEEAGVPAEADAPAAESTGEGGER